MRIIGYHISGKVIANSDGEYTEQSPYLDFLLQPKPEAIKILYHMESSLAKLLRLIETTPEEGKRLWETGQFKFAPYLIRHAPSRFLSMKKGFYQGNPFAVFSDADQYRRAKLADNEGVDECIAKAKEAQKTGEEVYEALCSLGLQPKTLASPIRVYDNDVLSKMDLPTATDIPPEAGFFAYGCCKWGWRDCYRLGHWEKSWRYDLSSAFPSEIAKLLDTRFGRWVESREFVPEATYGFCKGVVSISSPLSPIIYQAVVGNTKMSYTPTGVWEDYLTLKTIDFINKWKLGSFRMEKGWFWIADKKIKPLEKIMRWLYEQKESSQGVKKEVVKKISNSCWGLMCQTKRERGGEEFGEHFNPVWGAEVETNVRLKTAEFALKAGVEHLIHIAVDEALLDCPMELEGNGGMGEWRLKSTAPCLVVGTGALAVQGKKGTADFSIGYDWLLEQMRQNPEAKEYTLEAASPITLGVAVSENLFDRLGELRRITKTIPIGGEAKRYYPIRPKNGGDLLAKKFGSEPWDISLIGRPK